MSVIYCTERIVLRIHRLGQLDSIYEGFCGLEKGHEHEHEGSLRSFHTDHFFARWGSAA